MKAEAEQEEEEEMEGEEEKKEEEEEEKRLRGGIFGASVILGGTETNVKNVSTRWSKMEKTHSK